MLADTDRVSISRFFTDSEEKKVLQETDFLRFLVLFMEILWWKFKESFLQLYLPFFGFCGVSYKSIENLLSKISII